MTSKQHSQERLCGIDLGGTTAKLAVADGGGNILARSSFSTQVDGRPEAVTAGLIRHARRLLEDVGGETYAGIGVGVPGLIDLESGTVRFLPNFPTQWRGVPLAATLGEAFGCTVRLLNDARTATLAELTYGSGVGRPNVCLAFFTIGTGVGGGVVIDGRLRLGALGAAGELGHQVMVADGLPCGCGGRGCLETLASGPAIAAEGVRLMRAGLAPSLRELTEGDEGKVSPRVMGQAAEADHLVAEAIERAASYLGLAAANVVTILHPDRIVLGGGVSRLGARLVEPVERAIRERVGMFPTDGVTVECSTLGSDAGLLGAVSLAGEAAAERTSG